MKELKSMEPVELMRHDRITGSLFVQMKYMFLCAKHFQRIRRSLSVSNVSALVDAVFNDFGNILTPLQIRSEIEELLEILRLIRPENIIEIGSANGGTLFLFSGVSSEEARIIGIDLPCGRFRRTYSIIRRWLFQSFVNRNKKMRLIEKHSQKKSTLKAVEACLKDNKADFLFIDGDHSYEGVKKDYELYSPLIKDGGLICFHDIVRHPEGIVAHAADVDKFWNEIKSVNDYLEIIESDAQMWGGIGVIRKGGSPSKLCAKIDFAYASLSNDVLLDGFSRPEKNEAYLWTETAKASIKTEIDASGVETGYVMEINAMPYIFSGENHVDVYVNGVKVKRLFFEGPDKRRFRIYFSRSLLKPEGEIEIGFSFSPRLSPFEAGISSDKRKLGLAIFDLEIKSTGINA